MKVVVDTNKIFSSLIPKYSKTRDTLLESDIYFYSPNFVFVELFKHKEKLLKYCKLTEIEFYSYLNGIINNIHFIIPDYISIESRQIAYDLCYDIDLKDTPFVALAIDINAKLWSADKKLKKGLKKKGYNNFFGGKANGNYT